ncbi:hypothetical protein MMC30_008762 [Trapelia coarctata]|nr:hypothetical protein [Trapelia coarctata]
MAMPVPEPGKSLLRMSELGFDSVFAEAQYGGYQCNGKASCVRLRMAEPEPVAEPAELCGQGYPYENCNRKE